MENEQAPDLRLADWTKLPVPTDDGAAAHLEGLQLPALPLASTDGRMVDLSVAKGITVVYAYPRTGEEGKPVPDGWDMVPGARGCTPQSCAFRDSFKELKSQGVQHLFGLSTQTTAYQQEAAERLHLPFPILSDNRFELAHALNLPSFEFNGERLLKRLTMIIKKGRIEKVFYPVFPPDQNPSQVIAWLESRSA